MQLRVLTLNVWGLPLGIARHSAARMRAIGQEWSALDADIIALQEVWTAESRALLRKAAEAAGYHEIWHRRAAFGGSGLMVISRLPTRDIRFISFQLKGLPQRPQHADYYGGKGFVALTFETPAGPLVVINTHLHAGYSPSHEQDEYEGIRAAQAIQLAAFVRTLREPVIALGDFNSDEEQPARHILLGLSGLKDSANELNQTQATAMRGNPYRGQGADDARIDLILSRRGEETELRPLASRRVLDAAMTLEGEPGAFSDHAGVMADFELRAHAEPEALPRPPAPEALALAKQQMALGLRISRQRQRREAAYAGGGLAVSAALGVGAWQAQRSRRQWLFRSATGLAGLGLLGASGLFFASRSIGKDEAAGYADLMHWLDSFQPGRAQHDRLPNP